MACQWTTPASEESERSLRCLRYFSALLTGAYQAAREGGVHQDTLRATRMDLGINIPELDVVMIWSTHPREGSVSIPFADFILGQILTAFEGFSSTLSEKGMADRALEYRRALSEALKEVTGGLDTTASLPRLTDQVLPEPVLAALCADGGLLERVRVFSDGCASRV